MLLRSAFVVIYKWQRWLYEKVWYFAIINPLIIRPSFKHPSLHKHNKYWLSIAFLEKLSLCFLKIQQICYLFRIRFLFWPHHLHRNSKATINIFLLSFDYLREDCWNIARRLDIQLAKSSILLSLFCSNLKIFDRLSFVNRIRLTKYTYLLIFRL